MPLVAAAVFLAVAANHSPRVVKNNKEMKVFGGKPV
jgi:hypothetical protein